MWNAGPVHVSHGIAACAQALRRPRLTAPGAPSTIHLMSSSLPSPNEPLPLSVAIVCKNNESTIGRTLDSVRGLAREIVAVDSGSTDGTISLLRAANARIIPSEWLGHIATKQKALEACAQPWILMIDSDESVEPELARSIRTAIERDDASVGGYEVNRKVWYAGGFLEYMWQPEWRLRLARTGAAKWGGRDPHDKLALINPSGGVRTERLVGDLRHDSFVTLTDYLRAQVAHAQIAAETYRQEGRRGSYVRLLGSPVGAWVKQVVFKQAWRDGWRGLCAASGVAVATAMKHMILIERTRWSAPEDASADERALSEEQTAGAGEAA